MENISLLINLAMWLLSFKTGAGNASRKPRQRRDAAG
jgi:hypothetical protein